jgi:hypothetical protein
MFTMLAFLAQIVIVRLAFGRGATLKSKFLGLPLISVGWRYLFVQFIVGAVLLALSSIVLTWVAVIVQVIILGASAICLIATEISITEVERVEQKVAAKVYFIKSLQAEVEGLVSTRLDSEVKTSLKKLAEKIRYSDPMSNPQLAEIEGEITVTVAEIKTAMDKQTVLSSVEKAATLLDIRNRQCKLLK